MNRLRNRTGQTGFTLLEVLVAFVLLAMMLGVILNLNSSAMDTTARASDRLLALMLAQSELDRVLAEPELRLGTLRGDSEDDRFEWELEVSRFEFPDTDPGLDSGAPEPFRIDINVNWDRNQSLSLSTLRLVQRQ
ncbi:MAG: type IV pilus modification PilV family protein [Marinobacterium sp.]